MTTDSSEDSIEPDDSPAVERLIGAVDRVQSQLDGPAPGEVSTKQLAQAIAAQERLATNLGPNWAKDLLAKGVSFPSFKIPDFSSALAAAAKFNNAKLIAATSGALNFNVPSVSTALLRGLNTQTPALQAAAAVAMSNIDFSGVSTQLARQINSQSVNWPKILGPTLSPRQVFAEPDEASTTFSAELKSPASYFKRDEGVIDSFEKLSTSVKSLVDLNPSMNLVWRGARDARWGLHSGLFLALMAANGVQGPEKEPTEPQPFPTEDQMVGAERAMLDVAREQWRLDGVAPLELLARLQHHGAPTRLIDVTRNPYIAAWFAVEMHDETDDVDGRLFAFATRPVTSQTKAGTQEIDTTIRLKDVGGLSEPFWHYFETTADRAAADWGTGSKRRIWIPPAYDERIVAQNAGFLIDGVPITSKKAAPYFKKGTDSRYWTRSDLLASASVYTKTAKPSVSPRPNRPNFAPTFTFRITARAKQEVRDVLEQRFSYSRSTLYPDIGALAVYLRDNIASLL